VRSPRSARQSASIVIVRAQRRKAMKERTSSVHEIARDGTRFA